MEPKLELTCCDTNRIQSAGIPMEKWWLVACLALTSAASPGAAQGVVGVPTPQQSLDDNIGGLRSSGPVRNAPTPQYYPPQSARSHDRHPGADALLSPTGARVAPAYGGHRHKTRAGRRKAR